ncbi:MAG: glucosaminidase domain-containing protein [Streptococcaceae bacterium]|jgi:flagellum-specific peptidoglycan hydrolase FlgJ|nr:glucosaminidase domain-containing protein [Streptococcaceae bacterium]
MKYLQTRKESIQFEIVQKILKEYKPKDIEEIIEILVGIYGEEFKQVLEESYIYKNMKRKPNKLNPSKQLIVTIALIGILTNNVGLAISADMISEQQVADIQTTQEEQLAISDEIQNLPDQPTSVEPIIPIEPEIPKVPTTPVEPEIPEVPKQPTKPAVPEVPNTQKPPVSQSPKTSIQSYSKPNVSDSNKVNGAYWETDNIKIAPVNSLSHSNLSSFELPLLSSLKDSRQAAIIAAGLKRLGGQKEYTSLNLINDIYQEVFNLRLGENYVTLAEKGNVKKVEEAKIGDIFMWEDVKGELTKSAIYLGQEKYIVASKNQVHIESLNDKKDAPTFALDLIIDKNLTPKGQEYIDTYAASFDVTANVQTQNFINELANDARALGTKYDIYASVMIAQAILESGSGSSGLATAPNYNLFGIKGTYETNAVQFSTNEDDGTGKLYTIQANFRKYPSYKESLEDYTQLLRGGVGHDGNFYQGTWKSNAKNYLQATQFLTGKYATDTQYNNKLNSIIAAYHLTQYDVETIGTSGEIISEIQNLPVEYQKEMKLTPYDGKEYNLSGSYPVGQCTWYVFNRMAQLGYSIDNYMGNGGDWGRSGLTKGYDVSHVPAVGDAISFSQGVAGADPTYGHVAFVEAIGPQGIVISESNVKGLGIVSYRIIPDEIAFSSSVTYIAPKK